MPKTIRAVVTALALFAAFAGPARAADKDRPAGPLDQMDREMVAIGGQLRNARMRVERGIVSLRRPGADPENKSFIETCCRNNIETVLARMRVVQKSLENTRGYFDERENDTAIGILTEMDGRFRQLAEGVLLLARAPNEERATQTLTGLIRPWNEFRNGLDALRGCCPVEKKHGRKLLVDPADVEPDAGKKKPRR